MSVFTEMANVSIKKSKGDATVLTDIEMTFLKMRLSGYSPPSYYNLGGR